MAVLVLGGYGLIGSAVVERLRGSGASVIALGRDTGAAARRWPDVEWRTADLARLQTAESWSPLLTGVDAVVNAAGVLQQGLTDRVGTVQEGAMRALYAAAGPAGIRRIVQVSAVGADPGATTEFMRSKGHADAALAESGLPFVVLRPGLVVAPAAYGGTALLRALAAMPWIAPLILADRPVQTVWIGDVAEAVAAALEPGVADGQVVDLVERPTRTLRETVRLLRAWRGEPVAAEFALPDVIGGLVSALADGLGWLGWRSPLRSTALTVMREGVVGDAGGGPALLGRELASLPQALARLPATPQERWFGRLWLAKPLILATLSLFWIVSGAIGLARLGAAAGVLVERGLSADLASASVRVGSTVDLILGLAVLVRPFSAVALKAMVLVGLGYMLGAALVAPDLWADPLGPMIKTVPALVLALVALALLEAR